MPATVTLTTAQKTTAASNARIPDVNGVWPDQPGYIETYDAAYAAWTLVAVAAAQQQVVSVSSENTSVQVAPPDWAALREYFAGQSVLLARQGGMGVLVVPTTRLRRQGMIDDDIDTDMG